MIGTIRRSLPCAPRGLGTRKCSTSVADNKALAMVIYLRRVRRQPFLSASALDLPPAEHFISHLCAFPPFNTPRTSEPVWP